MEPILEKVQHIKQLSLALQQQNAALLSDKNIAQQQIADLKMQVTFLNHKLEEATAQIENMQNSIKNFEEGGLGTKAFVENQINDYLSQL